MLDMKDYGIINRAKEVITMLKPEYCWYCGSVLRNHNIDYCRHIHQWKTIQCKRYGKNEYTDYHREPFDPTNTKWGRIMHHE
jgi:hypothetical protein